MSHYKTLGVTSTASAAEIKAAFRNLAKQYHPDKNPGDKAAEARFKEISAAFEVLGDSEKRSKYDAEQTGSFRFNAGAGTGGYSASDFARAWQGGGQTHEDLLAEILRQRAAKGARGFPEYENVKNRDIQLTYNITLEEAFTGKEHRLKYNVAGESRELNLKIPAGFQSGMKIRHAGLGDHAAKAIPPGDLFVTINIIPHARFTRNGDDLTVQANVDYLQAIVGGSVEVETIDGSILRLKVPQGTQPGKVVRVVGRGMPNRTGRGDLYVEFDVVAPTLSDADFQKIQDIVAQRKG